MAKKNTSKTVGICSLCGKEDDGSDLFLTNDTKKAAICSQCATLLADYSTVE